MAYRITVTEVVTVEETVKGAWGPMSGDKDASYGYRPDRVEPVRREVQRYTQEVRELDLTAVIRAVNGIA